MLTTLKVYYKRKWYNTTLTDQLPSTENSKDQCNVIKRFDSYEYKGKIWLTYLLALFLNCKETLWWTSCKPYFLNVRWSFRLYPEDEYRNLSEVTPPEMVRTNLSCAVLNLMALGIGKLRSATWRDLGNYWLYRRTKV